jgi:hypothetical protein
MVQQIDHESSSSTDITRNQKTKKNKKTNRKENQQIRTGTFWEAIMDPKLVWRPTINDVERISWGKPAKKKGTGSRGVPHRLNQDERLSFERARKKGYLEIDGSGWRSQRRDAPLLNTYRSLCDARGQPSIVLHKQSNTDGVDTLVVDISPLRTPHLFETVAHHCLVEQPNGEIFSQDSTSSNPMTDEQRPQQEYQENEFDDEVDEEQQNYLQEDQDRENEDLSTTTTTTLKHEEDLSLTLTIIENANRVGIETDNGTTADDDIITDNEEVAAEESFGSDWYTRPIYQIPPYCIAWDLPRSDAKALGKKIAELFDTQEANKTGTPSSSKKPIGVKPGKNRRHGGYGIG